MSDRNEVTQQDVLAALDAAQTAVFTARRMVELFTASPTTADGRCKHVRQRQTFTGMVCMDCGDDLPGPASQGERGHGVASDHPSTPTL